MKAEGLFNIFLLESRDRNINQSFKVYTCLKKMEGIFNSQVTTRVCWYMSPCVSLSVTIAPLPPGVSSLSHCHRIITLVTSMRIIPLFRHQEPRAWENAVIREKFKHSSSKNISHRLLTENNLAGFESNIFLAGRRKSRLGAGGNRISR